uniref:Uncharacterized protein n=1 Tax=Bactrocera dorsalis TaxID=27457 RepID=A0A034V9R0_BACDO
MYVCKQKKSSQAPGSHPPLLPILQTIKTTSKNKLQDTLYLLYQICLYVCMCVLYECIRMHMCVCLYVGGERVHPGAKCCCPRSFRFSDVGNILALCQFREIYLKLLPRLEEV